MADFKRRPFYCGVLDMAYLVVAVFFSVGPKLCVFFLYEFKAQLTLMLSLLGLVLEMQCGLIDHRVSENCGKFNLVPSSRKRHIGPPQLFLLDFLQDTWVNEIRTSLACHLNSGG